jgi:anti-sigma regulatory factor (Ser/Thr protein kinase)
MLAVPLESIPPGYVGHWPLTSTLQIGMLPGAVPCARHYVTHILREWNLSHLADSAQVIVSELVTNAILHGAGPVKVCLRAKEQSLLIEVWDELPSPPEPRDHAADDEGGRGLGIVSLLSHRWGYYPESGGKCVWAFLRPGLMTTWCGT